MDSLEVFTVLDSIFTSFVWRMHSITGVLAAFLAGIYAEIRMVSRLIAAAAMSVGADKVRVRGTSWKRMLAKFWEITEMTSPMLMIPTAIPMGMPIMPMQNPSNNTELRSCFAVAPTEERMPNCCVRLFSDMLNEL